MPQNKAAGAIELYTAMLTCAPHSISSINALFKELDLDTHLKITVTDDGSCQIYGQSSIGWGIVDKLKTIKSDDIINLFE
jgi:hypothetical protein